MSKLDAYRFMVEGSSSDHFIYPFSKQLSTQCVLGCVFGIRAEAIIERDTIAAHMEPTFWRGPEAGSVEAARCITTKCTKCREEALRKNNKSTWFRWWSRKVSE